jgi:hypothetical protein
MNRRDLSSTAGGALCIFAIVHVVIAGSLDVVSYEHLWQLAPPAWLVDKSLWSVIVSFHAQPPGLITLQWAGANLSPKIIELSLLLSAAAYVCCSGVIAAAVTKSRIIGLLTALYISLHPSTLLYSHWFFSPIYLSAFVAITLVLILYWARSGNVAFLAWALVVLSLASLFHAAYLPALLFSLFLMLFLLFQSNGLAGLKRPGIFIPMIFSLAIGFFAPVKNYVVFDIFASSSWGRLNLAKLYTDQDPWARCEQAVRASKAKPARPGNTERSGYAGLMDADLLFAPVKPRGAVNLNHVAVLQCQESTALLARINSRSIGGNFLRAGFELFTVPAWDYKWLGSANLRRIEPLVKTFELFVSRGVNPRFLHYSKKERGNEDHARPEGPMSLVSIATVVMSVLVIFSWSAVTFRILAGAPRIWRGGVSIDPGDAAVRAYAAVAYACLLAGLILAIMILANGEELNRMRFSMSPLFLAALGWAVRSRWSPSQQNHPLSPAAPPHEQVHG